ncbi:putative BEL1-like homeodomain protein 4 [Iris pallida]|uniref:BEL1-like homeodomain protein 4 n=1 Tax=Iris pallida TaxID=29817 RepID=A0AAX6I650_IRIPA|nr:putative BEL1-like homeodomain protein 4 [Iris pallida]
MERSLDFFLWCSNLSAGERGGTSLDEEEEPAAAELDAPPPPAAAAAALGLGFEEEECFPLLPLKWPLPTLQNSSSSSCAALAYTEFLSRLTPTAAPL